VGRLSPKITGEGGEVSKKVAELAQLFSSLCPAKLAGLSQLRTFFGFFALIFVVKRCVFTVAL
jgi:hypothetical protein